MKAQFILVALGLSLVAGTITPPTATQFFNQTSPPNPQPVQLLGKSHISLIADLFWIRAIGVTINLKVPADGAVLLVWCDFVTELDPRFIYPYILGALLAPMSSSAGNYNVKESAALLRKGIKNIPGDHRLALYLSFNQLHMERDPKAAAQTLREGARIPKAPAFMGQLATRLLAQTDDFESARAFADELAQNSSDPEVRALFEHRRLEVERDRLLVMLQRAIDAYQSAQGHPPESLMQLLSEGYIAELPEDPLGGEFRLGTDGKVVAPSGNRLKVHFQGEDP